LSIDKPRIARAIREILEAIGEDPDREGLLRTPERVADMYEEIFAGLAEDPAEHLSVTFAADHDEMIMVKDIPLYFPSVKGDITGLSKLPRLVDAYARRPQVQERLTSQIADQIDEKLSPRGVLVVVEAEHLCMSMRGVRMPGTTTVTSAVRGLFRDKPATRAEAMAFIHGGR
jgi:GTP cyclohydrolase IA